MMTSLGLTSRWLRFDVIIPCIVANIRDCKKRREGVMVKGAECNHREFYSICASVREFLWDAWQVTEQVVNNCVFLVLWVSGV